MSRKPYIKIVYPDASEIAMLLTEAMVRRASGKRVVETESAERENAGQDLFAGTLCCVTETSVELTLNLAPEAMDFALATLIAKNLTPSERDKAMAASDSLELDALFAPQAAAGQDKSCTDEVGTLREPTEETQSGEQEAKIEIGKIKDRKLRDILRELIDCSQGYVSGGPDAYNDHINNIIDQAVKDIDCAAGEIDLNETYNEPIKEDTRLTDSLAVLICGAQRVQPKKTTELRLFANNLALSLNTIFDIDEPNCVVSTRELKKAIADTHRDLTETPGIALEAELAARGKARSYKELSWDDVMREARSLGKHKADRANRADEANAEQDGEIEPGLLHDIDEDKSSSAEVRSAPLADEEAAEQNKSSTAEVRSASLADEEAAK